MVVFEEKINTTSELIVIIIFLNCYWFEVCPMEAVIFKGFELFESVGEFSWVIYFVMDFGDGDVDVGSDFGGVVNFTGKELVVVGLGNKVKFSAPFNFGYFELWKWFGEFRGVEVEFGWALIKHAE